MNDNVFDLNGPDKKDVHRKALVEALKDLVTSVEEGEVTSIVGVAAKNDGSVFTIKGGMFCTLETITAVNTFLDILKLELLMKLDDALIVHGSLDELDMAETEGTNTDDVSVESNVSDLSFE